MYKILIFLSFSFLISCTPNNSVFKKSDTQSLDKVMYGTVKSSVPVKIESDGTMGALLGGVLGGIIGKGDILNDENNRDTAGVYGAILGGIIGYVTETKLGNHDGFQYIIDIKDDDEDIAIVQVGKNPIENGKSVVVVVGNKVTIAPYNE